MRDAYPQCDAVEAAAHGESEGDGEDEGGDEVGGGNCDVVERRGPSSSSSSSGVPVRLRSFASRAGPCRRLLRLTRRQLVHFGAAAAAHGGIELNPRLSQELAARQRWSDSLLALGAHMAAERGWGAAATERASARLRARAAAATERAEAGFAGALACFLLPPPARAARARPASASASAPAPLPQIGRAHV